MTYSEDRFGAEVAAATRDRLKAKFDAITAGLSPGHSRADVSTRKPIRFVTERPFVIAFDPETKVILRIVHGARDMRRLFR